MRIPRETVAWALSVAPARVTLYDRRGAPAFTLDAAGQEGVRFGGARFGIGVTNLYYQEPETDARDAVQPRAHGALHPAGARTVELRRHLHHRRPSRRPDGAGPIWSRPWR